MKPQIRLSLISAVFFLCHGVFARQTIECHETGRGHENLRVKVALEEEAKINETNSTMEVFSTGLYKNVSRLSSDGEFYRLEGSGTMLPFAIRPAPLPKDKQPSVQIQAQDDIFSYKLALPRAVLGKPVREFPEMLEFHSVNGRKSTRIPVQCQSSLE